MVDWYNYIAIFQCAIAIRKNIGVGENKYQRVLIITSGLIKVIIQAPSLKSPEMNVRFTSK